MPVPSFLSSFADKAQSAINASPLAGHLPTVPGSGPRPTSPDPATQPTANEAAAQGGAKSHTLEALQYQFRSLQQQYSTTTPIQKIITAEKGLAIDFDSVSRNSKAQSKEFYTWGQTEAEDLKDVTDRLAYLNFVQGSLATSLSAKLDSARAPFKAVRDAEIQLQPHRNVRASIQLQISRLEHEQQKGGDKRIADLREQLRKAEFDDQQLERGLELSKRKAVRESEQIKWDAIREYGEKLVLLSQAAPLIIAALPSIPPTLATPYTGAQTTGAVRASLQRALDNYKTGHIHLPHQLSASDLSRSDTRSFGESHASELSSIHSEASAHLAVAPTMPSASLLPVSPSPVPVAAAVPHITSAPPPINPNALNQAPTQLPSLSPVPVPTASHGTSLPAITPTIAETGDPVSAGPKGPGPASGSLHDIKRASETSVPRTDSHPASQDPAPGIAQPIPVLVAATPVVKPESAEEEKKRLASTYSQQSSSTVIPVQPTPEVAAPIPVVKHESAEEEKRRLATAYSQQSSSTAAPTPAPAAAPAAAPAPSTAAPSRHPTAEEEKKRLEREERERMLHADTAPAVPPKDGDEEDLPPYQEPGMQ